MSPKKIPDSADLSLSIDALKKRVLDAAVRGELTEQLPEDGTAKDLLVQIADEKKRLMAEGKIRKEKPLPEITEEEIPFEIPGNWEWVRLNNICLELLVPQRDKPTVFDGDIPWCRIEDIEGMYLNGTKSNQYVSQETIDRMNLRVNPVGTVLCSCSASLGVAAIVKRPCCINQTFIGLVLSSRIFNEYIYYYMIQYGDRFRSLGTGTTIPYISKVKFQNLCVPVPPLAEQHRIVKRIDEAFHQLEELKELQAAYSSNLDALRNKVIEEGIKGNLTKQNPTEDGTAAELLKEIEAEKQELIKAGKLKKEKPLPEITEEEKPFKIPENWEWVRFGDLCSLIHYGYTSSASECGNAHLLRITDIQNNTVCWDKIPYCTIDNDTAKKYALYDNDILFARTGGTVGKSYIVSGISNDEIYVFASYLIRAVPCPSINANYLKIFMESSIYWNQIVDNSIGSGQPNVNGESLKRIVLPLPPLAEQRRIVEKIDEVLALIE